MEERFEQVEQRVGQHGELIAELRAATLAISRQVGELQQATANNAQNLDRLIGISERFITATANNLARLDQTIEELRASNRRQEAIKDYLIRRDQERSNN
ncbi:hypothetical protein [Gloeobacter kilaueensis]|uniref:Uncharacterized protein n=1 Tax=Gloeobacter kilaueensis (strain ATCC BAA-2537 / CCAP 1431/1 / ULC 316 / JS1) TaxID=1183438 RepID=U5QNT7_GLOK1|nr:hypothetical protein [Gloeobacter kilaueensis]AGY60601.1 hypothetical protein GKIL_4355 [Gloeobacter kilaueensis JS1]